MKTFSTVVLFLSLTVLATQAQTTNNTASQAGTVGSLPVPTEYQITDQGAHYRVWQRETYATSFGGLVQTNIHKYTELASGLNHFVKGQWVESKEEIVILPDGGAEATNGQHQAYFPSDIYSGVIRMVTPDGVVLQSRPVGMSYDDGSNTVMIAELTNSVGYLVGSNQVIYPDAFTGFKADLCYTYTKSGFEQDVILRQQPPTPESLGLNADTAKLQLLTEFFSPPQPTIQASTLPVQAELALEDQSLGFGRMQMTRGRAFLLGESALDTGVWVGKQWVELDGRQFLVEEVPVNAVADGLAALPLTAMNSGSGKASHMASRHLALPRQRLAKNGTAKTVMLAKAGLPSRGFVLDYQTVNSSLTNYTFQGDTTYFISGTVNLYGTNTIEGGAVLKYVIMNTTNFTGGSVNLMSGSTFNCQTAPYRPAIFTAKDDNTVGETIGGSTGTPSGYYAFPALTFNTTATLSNFRVAWAYFGIDVYGGSVLISHGQLINCSYGIDYSESFSVQNLLFANSQTDFYNSLNTYLVSIANSTFSGSAQLVPYGNLSLTNCILANVTNVAYASGDHNGFYKSSVFGTRQFTNTFYPFQTVGAGSYYLTNGCAFRSAGTTNIALTLLASLQQKTTYPPMVCSNVTITTNLVLSPQAPRDTNSSPDLGYHYDPIDYAMNATFVPGVTLTLSNGVAIAGFGDECLNLFGSILISQGTPNHPNHLIYYNSVQEQQRAWGTSLNSLVWFSASSPGLNMSFTDVPLLQHNAYSFNGVYAPTLVALTNCEFYSGQTPGLPTGTFILKNDLLGRMVLNVGMSGDYGYNAFTLFQDLLYGGSINFYSPSTSFLVFNNSFHGTTISGLAAPVVFNHNAFINSTYSDTNNGDVTLTNFIYATGTLGSFYQASTNLVNMGNTNANLLGLYHYTTQTNQVPETNSIVDIGYHYVTTDAHGNPLDSNGDGIPDYLEDANGNGLVDNGETNWALAILQQPTNQIVVQNSNATFSVTAAGINPISYQWQFNGTNLPWATTASLTLTNAQITNAGNYFVVVTNNFGLIISTNALLTMLVPPSITVQPGNQTVVQGSNATFSVTATGTAPLSYQWLFNATNLVFGATNASLTLTNVQAASAGIYSVAVTNAVSSTTSSNAVLTVNPPPCDPVPSGIVAWWKAEGNALDSIGGNNGALMNGTSFTNGEVGMAFQLNGVHNFVLANPSAPGNLDVGQGSGFTIEGWINPTTTSPAMIIAVYEKALGTSIGSDESVAFVMDNTPNDGYIQGCLAANIVDTGGAAHIIGSPANAVVVGVWQHVALSYDKASGIAALYANGASVARANLGTFTPQTSFTNLEFGAQTTYASISSPANVFSGRMDELSLYNRALSSNEIAAIYNAGSAGKCLLPPIILGQPTNQTVNANANATYSVTATGTAPLSYQWYFNGTCLLNGATNSSLTIPNVQPVNAGNYSVVVSNLAGSVTSSNALLTVLVPPVITVQPGNQSVVQGSNATFNVTATGTAPLNYKWYFNGTTILTWATNPSLTITNVQPTNAGNYSVTVSNLAGSVISTNALLTVLVPPSITVQPGNQTVVQGSNAMFNVTATGTAPLSYQWYFNGTGLLNGATNSSLTIPNVQPVNAGNYSVVVSNQAGSVTSSNAALMVMSWTADSDYDGRSDAQEILDGTDPFNPNSVLTVLLAYFPFDNTNTFAGSGGQLPLAATNVVGVPSWSTNAVLIDSTNPAILSYRDVETNGNANINLRSGTVWFWFKPDWSSVNAGGSGPGACGRLIEMGNNHPVFITNSWVVCQTNGWWALYLTPDGNTLTFGSSTNGFGGVNLSANIAWTSNQWHQVVLTYTSTNSLLYLDGQLATNGAASIYYPNLVERSAGFRIGSDQGGTNQARGTFDDLETYNYPLNAAEIETNYQAESSLDSLGIGMANIWQMDYFGHLGVDPNGNPAGDGLSNQQKAKDNLNPFVFYPGVLGYWQFNNPPYWLDYLGLAPSTAYDLYPVLSWSGDAVSITPAQNSKLSYPSVRPNGSDVVICPAHTGTIQFWFKPNWASFSGAQGGPNDDIRLFEIGQESTNAAYGWFCLWVNPLGTTLTFSTEANGIHTDNATCPASFTTNAWYQIVLSYTPSNSVIYVNGMALSNIGVGVANCPSQAVLTQGFQLGCSLDGVDQANGCFDELETFNYALTASEVMSDYVTVMGIDTYETGLPDVVKNAYGLNTTAVDSDCDGLPDAWKIANGLNPTDPSVATPAMISAYASGSNALAPSYGLLTQQSNLVNIAFVTSADAASGSTMSGAVVTGIGSNNDVWNFCDINSAYFTGGVILQNAGDTAIGAKLYAYIGPCINTYMVDPSAFVKKDMEPTNWTDLIPGVTVSESEYFDATTYTNSATSISFLNGFNIYENPITRYSQQLNIVPDGTPITGGGAQDSNGNWLYHTLDYPLTYTYFMRAWYDPTMDNYYNSWGFAPENPFTGNYNGGICFSKGCLDPLVFGMSLESGVFSVTAYPFNFYYDSNWNTNGPYFNMSTSEQAAIQSAFSESDAYAAALNSYAVMRGFSNTNQGFPPLGNVSCYIPPFTSITHSGNCLAGTDGATWRFSGAGETQSGGWFKKFYPEARRTLLITGLSQGKYGVYVYYDSPMNVAPATINDFTAAAQSTGAGTKYWFRNVRTRSIPLPTNLAQCLNVPSYPAGISALFDEMSGTLQVPANANQCLNTACPIWWTNAQNGCIQINLNAPSVFDSVSDLKVLGVQLVRVGDVSSAATVLEVLPGLGAAYLDWSQSDNATNYNIYRSIGNTNSWVLLASTPQLTYQDVNLTAGATYYYQVAGVDPVGVLTNGTLEPASDVVSIVPFGCPNPVPPQIDYVNPMQILQAGGTYPLTYQMLLTNSDAFDPQGYPLVFKVDSVVSGSLMINGLPFSSANNVIASSNSVVWTPPAVMVASGTPAFRVYVFNGINRSANTVNVSIKQTAKTYLIAWGNNAINDGALGGDAVGCLGTGTMDTADELNNGLPCAGKNSDGYPAFMLQNELNIYPFDTNHNVSYHDWCEFLGDPPAQVRNIDSARSISTFGYSYYGGHCAVTSDTRLWFWGDADANVIGMPLVLGFPPDIDNAGCKFSSGPATWDSSVLDPNLNWEPLCLTLLSPVPVEDPATGQPMIGVSLAKDCFILKQNGELLSFGGPAEELGRQPQLSTDLFYGGFGPIGMVPGRVEIEGNDSSGIISGREIVEINTSGDFIDMPDQPAAALARCQDGSLWAWGIMRDAGGRSGMGIALELGGDAPAGQEWQPRRLTDVESASTSPIVQICESWNHIVIWRADGSLSELGYVPSFVDPSDVCNVGLNGFTYGPGSFDLLAEDGDNINCYTNVPVVVPNVPPNIRQLCVAPTFAAILTDSGEVWVWGQWLGQLLTSPQKIPSLTGITKIIAGYQYIIGLDKKGRLWGVGINNNAVFGFNDVVIGWTDWGTGYGGSGEVLPTSGQKAVHPTAVQVVGIENVVDVFTGDNNWGSQVYAIGTEVQGKPVGLTAAPMSQAVQLSWSNYPAASSYIIYRSLNEASGYVAIGNSAGNSYLDQNPALQNGQTYYYQVSAVVNGIETSPSWDVSATPYPSPLPVTNLTASWTCHGTELQWQPPASAAVSPVAEYEVLVNGVQLAELFPSATNYFDDTAVAGASYTYAVVVVNSAGQISASVGINSNSPVIPCNPAPVVATNHNPSCWLSVKANANIGSDQATLVWAGPTNGQWQFQSTEFDTFLGNPAIGISPSEIVPNFIAKLSQADSNLDPLSAWLWSQFTPAEISVLSDPNATVNANLATLVVALNQFLANGAPATNDFFVAAIESGQFDDVYGNYIATLRPETIALANSSPGSAALVQLKRMLLDDYYAGKYFTRGGNWGGLLTGFRIHYRIVQYVNGSVLENSMQQDVSLNELNYGWDSGISYGDDDSIPCGVYSYTWQIPDGALCWASVSVMVDEQEGNISTEIGPRVATPVTYSWNPSLRAVPGDQQVYLDWVDDADAFSYSLYYSINSNDTNDLIYDPIWNSTSWQPVPGASSLTVNRFWQTNLEVGTTYYYMIQVNDYFLSAGWIPYDFAVATVVSCPPTTQTNFFAYASPYDGMVLVEWTVPTNQVSEAPIPLNQTNWQFFVERKLAGTDDTNYVSISDSGFGLAYLDSDVVDGQSYTYRVTAFDTSFNRLQAVAVAKNSSGSTQITPSAANGLTLLPPVPGYGYVNLTWSPIRATQFSVKRALNPGGPFNVVGSQNVDDAYQNAQNTFLDRGVQNGVTYYYQIAAITPTGFEIDSAVEGVTPLATLTPPPPSGFQGTVIPINGANTIALSWNAESGVGSYQVFLEDQSSMTSLFTGIGTSCVYDVPADADQNAVFTFALRSASVQGLASDLVTILVTNEPIVTAPVADSSVVLEVAGSLGPSLTVAGPTNLTLNALVNVPGVSQVSFYDNGQLIGTVAGTPYQMIWYQAPGGVHVVTASGLIQSQDALSLFGIESPVSFGASTAIVVTNLVEPQLSAFQTSATDLQLPAPALPISLSRSYTSRSTATNGILGVGWTANWNIGSLKLSTDLTSGWQAVYQPASVFQDDLYFISEDPAANPAHFATMTLPSGQSSCFGVQLNYDPTTSPFEYDVTTIGIDFQDYSANPGSLSSNTSGIGVDCPDWDFNMQWDKVVFLTISPLNAFTYVGPDGTTNIFGQPLGDNLTWLLTKTVDLNGNSLNYTYDVNNNLTAISNSCGRMVTFTYPSPTEIDVYDMTALQQATGSPYPVVKYLLATVNGTNQLASVLKLKDRNGDYETTTYAYGNNTADQPDFNRLTDVYDPRGVRTLHNIYTNSASGDYTGDLSVQISPGRTNNFTIDQYDNLIVTATTSIATNTAEVTSDASGSISGATQPVSGATASSTQATQCSYDGQGNLISQTDANGNTTTYTYDSQNRLTGQSDGNGNGTSTELNNYGQPTSSTDANGNETDYKYDNAGNPLSVNDPSGTSTSYGYSSPVTLGNIYLGKMQTNQSQPAPFVPYTITTLNSYNTAGPILGDLLQTTEEWQDNGGAVVGTPVTTRYTYDANGNRTAEIKTRTVGSSVETDFTAYIYDAENRVVTTTVSATNNGVQTLTPQTTTVAYNPLGKQATSTDAAGRVTTSVYDYNGNLIETEYPDGTVSRTSYDGFGRQQYVQDRTVPDANGNTTAPATLSFYDASGRVIQTERCMGVELTKTTASINGDFTALPNCVPQVKLVVSSTGTVLTSSLTFYDPVGNVQYAVDARGTVTQYQYDAANRRTNALVYTTHPFTQNGTNTPSPTGPYQSTSYSYDGNGNQLTVTDAAGNTTTSVYDEANRVIEVDYPALSGTVSRYTYYDGLGRKIQENDEAGVATAYTYDFRGLLTSVTLALGTTQSVTTVYAYDELGNEINQTDAAGHSTAFQYDALGRRIGRTLPGGQSEGYCYDNVYNTGNLIYQTNFNGVVITNRYDVANRLTNCSAPGYQVIYAYGPTGLRTNMVDASGTNRYVYDSLSRLTNKVVAWHGGPAVAVNYGYDALGSLTNCWSSTANGVTNVYQYDLLGRLTTVLAGNTIAASYGYDIVGNLQSMRYANGVTNLYQYDSRNRLTNLVWNSGSTALAGFAYTVGPTGNRTALAETVKGTSRTYNWAYDYLYRMTGETFGGAGYTSPQTISYGFDAVGNRTNRTSNVSGIGSQTPAYTANDWLASDTCDSNGNTTGSGTINYQYDVLNHLTNVNNGQIVMVYDGDGNRASKTVNGTTTYYLVDSANPSGYAQVLEEYQGMVLSRVYNYGLGLISQRQVSSGTVSYFGGDGHGSTRFLADLNGNVTDSYVYDAYGLEVSSSGNTPNNYLYCGQQFDSDLGFYYLRARYYKPDSGRFWSMDTYEGNTEDPLSLHKYLYGGDDPVNNVDPSGNDFELGGMLATLDIGGLLAQISNPVSSKAAAVVLAKMQLSARGTDAGILERLLLAESRTPYGNPSTFKLDDVVLGMKAIGACVANRVKSTHFPNTIKEVITDSKNGVQFHGFDTYPDYNDDIRQKIIAELDWANTKNAKQQDYRSLISNAQTVAKQVINKTVDDPFQPKGGTYFLRTQGSAAPGPASTMPFLGDIAGNSFYSMKSP